MPIVQPRGSAGALQLLLCSQSWEQPWLFWIQTQSWKFLWEYTGEFLTENIHIPSLQTLQQQLKNGSAASATQFSTTVSCARMLCTAIQVFIFWSFCVFSPPAQPRWWQVPGCPCALGCPHAWGCPMPSGCGAAGLGAASDNSCRREGMVGVEPILLYRPPQLHHLGKKCGELQRHDRAALGRTSTAELLLLIRHPELSRSSGEPFMEQRSPCQEHPGDPQR